MELLNWNHNKCSKWYPRSAIHRITPSKIPGVFRICRHAFPTLCRKYSISWAPARSIHLSEYTAFKNSRAIKLKWAGVPSCINHKQLPLGKYIYNNMPNIKCMSDISSKVICYFCRKQLYQKIILWTVRIENFYVYFIVLVGQWKLFWTFIMKIFN